MDSKLNSKDAALKNLGRTIVNFQRLEQHVKALATIQSFTGTVAKIQQDRDRHIKKASGFTLGQAIGFCMETLEGNRPVPPFVPDLFDISMQGRISFELEGQYKDSHAQELRALVEYRNELIHGQRLAINWDSDAECDALFRELDDWNTRIGVQVDFLVSMRRGFASLKPEDFEVVEIND